MKDSMKDFIQQNKDSFDSFEPSENLWEKIEQKSVKPIRMVSLASVMRVAAVAVILLGVGLFFLLQDWEQPVAKVETPVEEEPIVPLSLANMSSEMAEVEVYYTTQISERMMELDQYEVDPDMMLEIEVLQNDYEELKKELGQGADRAKIVEAMIENYRLRIEILELILNELKEHKNDEPVYL